MAIVAGSPPHEPVRASWLAVPTAANPRLLLTARSPLAATRTLRRQLVGQRLRTRTARWAMSVGVGSGLPLLVPSMRVHATGPPDAASVEDPLREVLGVADVCLTMPIGPARANRKPVLQVTDPSGRVLAYAKVGHNDLTRRLVEHESTVLTKLAETGHDTFRSPRPMALLTWRGLVILVLEPLDIPTRRLDPVGARQRLVSVTHQIAGLSSGPSVPWSDHPYRPVLETGAAACGRLAGRVREQLDEIDRDAPVPTAAWHGDLNSGNLALVEGPCPVWDWERFQSGVPLGFDLLHHDLHQSVTVDQLPPRAAAEALLAAARRILEPLGVPIGGCDATARSYLLTLAQRYLADRQADVGADLGRVGEWLLPALESHPRSTTST